MDKVYTRYQTKADTYMAYIREYPPAPGFWLTGDVIQRKQRSKHNRTLRNKRRKTKKKFAGSYTEVNAKFDIGNPINPVTWPRSDLSLPLGGGGGGEGGGRYSSIKMTGVLVVPFRGLNLWIGAA